MWDFINVTSNYLYFHLEFKKILKITLNKKTVNQKKSIAKINNENYQSFHKILPVLIHLF